VRMPFYLPEPHFFPDFVGQGCDLPEKQSFL
jgi:hypothetical protein